MDAWTDRLLRSASSNKANLAAILFVKVNANQAPMCCLTSEIKDSTTSGKYRAYWYAFQLVILSRNLLGLLVYVINQQKMSGTLQQFSGG